jgi:ribonucleoside-diphosphate reductase subunit M2
MDSPVKALKLGGKENDYAAQLDDLKKPVVDLVKVDEKPQRALTPKELEATEPILQENTQRFVLFPIKYNDVSDFSTSTRHA